MIDKELKYAKKWLEEQDAKWPNRHIEIHKNCCNKCPANHNKKHGIVDPETRDIGTAPKEIIAKNYLFVCAWRPNKLCRGICEEYGIMDEKFIADCKNNPEIPVH